MPQDGPAPSDRPGQIVLPDVGSWISGPSISFDEVPAVTRGPFETADEARELPEVRAIYETWAPGSHLADGARQLLCRALDDAGVSLGAYDRALTAWIAGFEPQVVAVIASWVTRAVRGAR
jgi:hypothetical protein